MSFPGLRRSAATLVALHVGWATQAQSGADLVWSTLGHTQQVAALKISPDGTVLASGSRDNTIKIWDASDGRLLKSVGEHPGITDVAFSPDGSLLASRGNAATGTNHSINLWRISTGELIWTVTGTIPGWGLTGSVEFSPDGKLVAAGLFRTNQVGLWRVTDGGLEKTLEGGKAPVTWTAFSPDGSLLAGAGGIRGSDTSVKVWRVTDGVLIRILETSNVYGVGQLAFSPDGDLLAAGTDPYTGFGGNVQVWRVSDWASACKLPVKSERIAFSPDGGLLVLLRNNAASGSTGVDLWRVRDARLLHAALQPHQTNVNLRHALFAAGGRRLILGGTRLIDTPNGYEFEGLLSALRLPLILSSVSREANQLKLGLTGGSETVQLQRRFDLSAGWVDVGGPSHVRQFSIPLDEPLSFFRVVEIPE